MPANGVATKPLPGQSAFLEGQEARPDKKRWFKCEVDEAGKAILDRAIVLKLASIACTEPDDDQLAGQALVAIAKQWMEAEVERLSGG
jgi:hypothetical protein